MSVSSERGETHGAWFKIESNNPRINQTDRRDRDQALGRGAGTLNRELGSGTRDRDAEPSRCGLSRLVRPNRIFLLKSPPGWKEVSIHLGGVREALQCVFQCEIT